MDLTTLTGKLKESLTELAEAFKGFHPRLPPAPGKVSARLPERISAIKTRFLGTFGPGRIPAGKRQFIFITVGGLVILLVILIISSVVLKERNAKKGAFTDIAAGPFVPI